MQWKQTWRINHDEAYDLNLTQASAEEMKNNSRWKLQICVWTDDMK